LPVCTAGDRNQRFEKHDNVARRRILGSAAALA